LKRGGARAFGPRLSLDDFESYLYPAKRFGSLSPYYFYQQPKRGGGRSFNSYWEPPSGYPSYFSFGLFLLLRLFARD
uniref:Neuropeptide-Like Protein n=1 Tax=Anisakis simplex TaxID=6269 RepID=A0A0M3JM65_ANISI